LAEVLRQHVKILSERYPNRFAGEPQEKEAGEYIRSKFEEYDLVSELFEVPVMGWEVTKEPKLEIVAPENKEIECAPFIFSGSTPGEGIRGELKFVGETTVLGSSEYEKFALCDPETDRWRGFIVGNRSGPACAQPGPPSGFDFTRNGPHYTWPCCFVGNKDLIEIREWLERHKKVEVIYSVKTRFKPDSTSCFVEARIDGTGCGKRRLIIGGHHDSMGAKGFPLAINSPGAMDNASGVAVVLELAKFYREKGCQKGLTFCTFGGEERNFLMSSEYVRIYKEKGELSRYDCCLIVDGAAKGKILRLISSSPDDKVSPKIDLQEMVSSALKELSLGGKHSEYPIRRISPPPPRSDEWPLWVAGVPVFRACWTQDYGDTYHRKGDTLEYCNEDQKFLFVFEIYKRMIEKLSELT